MSIKPILPLLLAAPLCFALNTSDVSMDLTRDTADTLADKSYTSSVLGDLCVRRHWDSHKGRSIDLDFDSKTNALRCVIITYDAPVPEKKATRDARDITHEKDIVWKSLPAANAAKYEMENARAAKAGNTYLLMECDHKGKCTRLSLHTALPDRNRAAMEPVTLTATSTSGAMGSNAEMQENARILLANEATRKGTSDTADTPADTADTEPEDSTEPTVTDTAADDDDTETVAVHTAMGTSYEKRPKQHAETETPVEHTQKTAPAPKENPLASIPVEYWGIGAGALVLLIILYSTAARRKEAERLAARAATIRTQGSFTQSTLRSRAGLPRGPRRR